MEHISTERLEEQCERVIAIRAALVFVMPIRKRQRLQAMLAEETAHFDRMLESYKSQVFVAKT